MSTVVLDPSPVNYLEIRMTNEHAFVYRGHAFRLVLEPDPRGQYQVAVDWMTQPDQATRLPQDADPYATAEEALRHGQQQAMRWVHDRTGDGQGQT
ncbi:hypothetical protein APR50_24385 [Variovorax paradoxus]|uniref:hypothetical protein n=1 Tax=Variovorax paradoxus TaxID=34073 RepID=UPI0006E4D761|nr:hypothetical protein APR50_24385 [Variovorax paradoxus]KPV23117.1 hypothetical protein APR51_08450 [Variovorax paradoxus]KPV33435.1 hypothetical protein APR48_10385 [Variovorax paradoxus]